MDFDAICHYCGEKLPHEKCSEKFTEKGRAFIQQVLNNWGLISVRTWVMEACAEIDRLTAKREHLLEKVALQGKEIERLTAENEHLERLASEALGGSVKEFELLLATERLAQQDKNRLAAELKAKDKALQIIALQKNTTGHLTGEDCQRIAEQALKENDE